MRTKIRWATIFGVLGLLCSTVFMVGFIWDKVEGAEHQPYGGCIEAIDYPRSEGADACRRAGWTVTRHIVVRPDKVVLTWRRLPPCANDEPYGGPCRWNFGPGKMGNGEGRAFWLNRNNRIHYVKGAVR
jgi:hypothetical protein